MASSRHWSLTMPSGATRWRYALLADAATDAERMIERLLDAGAPSVYLHGGIAERLSARLSRPTRQRLKSEGKRRRRRLDGAILHGRACGQSRKAQR